MEGKNNKKVIIVVGIPGVGKSTIVNKVVDSLNEKKIKTIVAVFGSLMLDEASKINIPNRDQIRNLPLSEQHLLQEKTAKNIALLESDIVIVDTHLFIRTSSGYYPGLPSNLLEIIKPSNLILILADSIEIHERRLADKSRNRDVTSIEEIEFELSISKTMLSTSSIISGAPFKMIPNHNEKVDDAVSMFLETILTDYHQK